jgi:hypothetical protein
MFKGIDALEFNKRFPDNKACYDYLMQLKWANGYSCSYCGAEESIKGKTGHHKRCKQCRYDESVTSNTIFHSMKMPILKAFHMIFRISVKKKGMSTIELGDEVSVQQKTAWLFKRKLQVAMRQDNDHKLSGKVDVDETLLGFHSNRKQGGRNLDKKKALMVGVEILSGGKVGNMRMQVIENFKALTLRYAIKDMVNDSAQIRTDDYCSYTTLQRTGMSHIQIERSQKGLAFEQIHRQIMQFKNWIVGTHHRWSKKHLYAYADEYVYRFNRRNARKSIFNSVIRKMMQQIPHPYPVINELCAYST